MGLVASRAVGFDDLRFGGALGVSCGFALRATVAAFCVFSVVVTKVALWMVTAVVGIYGFGAWTLRALVALLDWVGATY